MTDGARTRDIEDHNLALYQLSYGHQLKTDLPAIGQGGGFYAGFPEKCQWAVLLSHPQFDLVPFDLGIK